MLCALPNVHVKTNYNCYYITIFYVIEMNSKVIYGPPCAFIWHHLGRGVGNIWRAGYLHYVTCI